MTPGAAGDRDALYDLYAAYGALIDESKFDEWLGLFAETCTYHIVPRENFDRGLPAALVFCDSRAVLEDRIRALRDANKYNIHTDRHLIGLPRVTGKDGEAISVEAPFAVYQSDQEGETRLFATGLYRDRIVSRAGNLRFCDKSILLDTFAVPSLLATPL
jgi:anthranilate 1,2-dioxygenase small subunit